MIGGFFDDVSCPLFFHIFLALAKGNLIVTYFCSFTLATWPCHGYGHNDDHGYGHNDGHSSNGFTLTLTLGLGLPLA